MASSAHTESGEPSIALCLSGGGFRATLFHVGSLRRLNECGILSRIQTLSSVSGGSITNGYLATRWTELHDSLRDGMFTRFDDLIADPIREFCSQDLRTQVLLWDRVNPINWPQLLRSDYSVTNRLSDAYAQQCGFGSPLTGLPSAPSFLFLATNMANGGCWRFSNGSIGDWYTGYASPDDLTVADAVAASSAYPVAFPPLQLTYANGKEFRGGRGTGEERQTHDQITLTDGGVYDNLGIEPVRTGYSHLLVSDAGAPLDHEQSPSVKAFARVNRSLSIIWNQVGAQRKRWLIDVFKSTTENVNGAYWGLVSKVANYGLGPDTPAYSDDVVELLGDIRTDLDPFSEGEMACLENQGYALANVAVNRWTMELLEMEFPPFVWPRPDFVATDAAHQALKDSGNRGVLQDLWASVRERTDEWF